MIIIEIFEPSALMMVSVSEVAFVPSKLHWFYQNNGFNYSFLYPKQAKAYLIQSINLKYRHFVNPGGTVFSFLNKLKIKCIL